MPIRWRWPPENSCGYRRAWNGCEPDHVHHPADPLAALRTVADAVDAQALGDAVADRGAWVERRVRVLEDDLHPPPVGLERRPADARDVAAVEADRAGRRVDQPQQHAADGRLAAARTRRRARASRRARIVKSTPSTAWTTAVWRDRMPPLIGKCLTRPRTSTSWSGGGSVRWPGRPLRARATTRGRPRRRTSAPAVPRRPPVPVVVDPAADRVRRPTSPCG